MKKIFTTILLTMTVLCTWAQYDFEVDGICYIPDYMTKTATVTYKSLTGGSYSGSIVIPKTVTYGVLTYSVTAIGYMAFNDCSKLTSVTIPNSVTIIGDNAFNECSSLTSVTIPNSVTSIGKNAFINCACLGAITVENGNTIYDSRDNCNAIIEKSSNKLISGCINTVIPNSVTSIGSMAFYGCSGLASINIPNSVQSIGSSAFSDCSGLKSVTIGNSVTIIPTLAFVGCSGLTSVTIGNSVTTIMPQAFDGCSNLNSITIPKSVMGIGERAFYGCSGLESISVESENTVYDSRENSNAIIEKSSNSLIVGCKNTLIPNSVTSIGDDAFSLCTSLTSINIPNSVTSIGKDAFMCTGLTSINIPNSVKSIGNWAFAWCDALTSVYNYATTPQTLSSSDDFTNAKYCNLYVPNGSVYTYKMARYWKEFMNITEMDISAVENVTTVPSSQTSTYYYQINGTQNSGLQKGLNIIKTQDGVKKVMVK